MEGGAVTARIVSVQPLRVSKNLHTVASGGSDSFTTLRYSSSYRKYGVSLPYRAHLERMTGDKRSSTPMDEPTSKRQKVRILVIILLSNRR